MALPIQTAPIDRANRATAAKSARADGLSPSQIDPTKIICMICDMFPNLPPCKFISCPT
jgi:hypothetical protein